MQLQRQGLTPVTRHRGRRIAAHVAGPSGLKLQRRRQPVLRRALDHRTSKRPIAAAKHLLNAEVELDHARIRATVERDDPGERTVVSQAEHGNGGLVTADKVDAQPAGAGADFGKCLCSNGRGGPRLSQRERAVHAPGAAAPQWLGQREVGAAGVAIELDRFEAGRDRLRLALGHPRRQPRAPAQKRPRQRHAVLHIARGRALGADRQHGELVGPAQQVVECEVDACLVLAQRVGTFVAGRDPRGPPRWLFSLDLDHAEARILAFGGRKRQADAVVRRVAVQPGEPLVDGRCVDQAPLGRGQQVSHEAGRQARVVGRLQPGKRGLDQLHLERAIGHPLRGHEGPGSEMTLGQVQGIDCLRQPLDVGKAGRLADLGGHDCIKLGAGQQPARRELDLLEHKARAGRARGVGLRPRRGGSEPRIDGLGWLPQPLQLFALALQLGWVRRGRRLRRQRYLGPRHAA